MKKILFLVLSFIVVLSFGLTSVKAEETTTSTPSVSDWMPHNYILSGYQIPTAMEYDSRSVTFKGSLNAGIATTGFNYLKPIDLNNFSIDLNLNIPDIDKLSWISIGFLDKNLMMDAENDVAPVAMPFNAMSGKGGYSNNEQTGIIFQLYGSELAESNLMKFSFVEKNLDTTTGEKHDSGWKDVTSAAIEEKVKLNKAFDGNLSISFTANGNGLKMNVNNGAWKANDGTGMYTATKDSLNKVDLAGLKEYFSSNECYFSFVLMYKDEEHRPVELKVTGINGQNPSDNAEPSYLQPKTVESGNLKVTIPASAIGTFGVYPGSIDSVKITKYDSEDGDYETVQARATQLNAEILDYFRITPMVGTKNITLAGAVTVEYTIPEGYTDIKGYFINEDDEAQSIGASYITNSDGKLQIKVDNDTITKVIVYGTKKVEETTKKGCGGSIAVALPILFVLPAFMLAKRKNEE